MTNNFLIYTQEIENRIFNIRENHVMLDFHLAELYQVQTKRLNEQVKRNSNRFPLPFMFPLTFEEWEDLKSQIATKESNDNLKSQITTSNWGGKRKLPFVFTEQGVAMLSAVLKSETAIIASIKIIDAFVKMRKVLSDNALLFQRLNSIENKQLISEQKIEQVFKALESRYTIPTQGIFFDGQVFDAYVFISKIIRSAQKTIILIDNYIDESTLIHLSKKKKDVKVILLSKNKSKVLDLDVKKANEQYHNFEFISFDKSHDRFLIIDGIEVYHLGASLKDLGKKWFAFSILDKKSILSILNPIMEMI